MATDVCGSADDWENVTFDDEAAIAVVNACGADPALAGSVQPEGLLSDFDGTDGNGTWTLMITDDTGGDAGILQHVTLRRHRIVWCRVLPGAVGYVRRHQENGPDRVSDQWLRRSSSFN